MSANISITDNRTSGRALFEAIAPGVCQRSQAVAHSDGLSRDISRLGVA